jgi:hypothetical protein
MVDRFNGLAQNILHKQLADVTEEELDKVSAQYPYFAPAHFLLLKKLQPDSEAYNTQFQKAILFHYDPLSFAHFLNAQQDPVLNIPAIPLVEEEEYSETQIDDEEEYSASEEETIAIGNEEDFEKEQEETVFVRVEEDESDEEIFSYSEKVEEETQEENPEQIEAEEIDLSVKLTEEKKDALLEHMVEEEDDDDVASLPDETELAEEKVTDQELPKIVFNLPAEPKDSDLTFEPYHTVDYFASQGIKISQEAAAQDKFGKQLKSFTDWLKTMKKLPVSEMSNSISKSSEQKVENLAEHSVQDAEVVTESMAEVWEKQGKKEKAKEVYEKLSLLNPSKRAYFATKIQNLTEENI